MVVAPAGAAARRPDLAPELEAALEARRAPT
jgi:hypothetical protein